jgi:methionyl-tRNA formyltransferase
MRIIFFGTPELCIPYLEVLAAEHDLILIVCNPDQPVGRKQLLTPPPTAAWAKSQGIPCLQPNRLKGFEDELLEYNADIHVVIAYGKIIPNIIINQPKYGTLNVHYSLLPRWRGACPVESSVLHGDTETGVCIQQMRYELDTGPILEQESITLSGDEYARELRDGIMGEIGMRLLRNVLGQIRAGDVNPIEQSESGITLCYRIQKSDGELLASDDDMTRWRKYRAYMPWPGVFYFDQDGKRVKITQAEFKNGKFVIEKYIREGEVEVTL